MKRRRTTAEVTADIVRAASIEFEAKGYAGATMRDVAERAETSLSVTHRHFQTKARLFAAALVVPFADFLRDFAAEWAQRGPGDDETLIGEFVGELYRHLERHRAALEGIVGSGVNARGEILEAAREALVDVFGGLDRIGQEAASERGWLREDVAVRGERMTVLLVVGAVLARDLVPGVSSQDSDRLVEEMARFALYGLHQPTT